MLMAMAVSPLPTGARLGAQAAEHAGTNKASAAMRIVWMSMDDEVGVERAQPAPP